MAEISLRKLDTTDFHTQETYKALRTNISFCGDDIHTIAITSSFPNEGKSEVSLRLAYAFAETGAKTILVDADIRNSKLGEKLGVTAQTGLTHVLSGKEKNLQGTVKKTDIESLDILFPGANAPNPAELLGKERFTLLLQLLREKYDYVIIDCPPLIPVIDAAIIAKQCDGTLMVISQGDVRKRDAKKSLDQLKLSGAHILGTVLNKVEITQKKYGKYGKYQPPTA